VTISRTARRVILGVLIAAFLAAAVLLWRSGLVTPIRIKDWLVSLGPAGPLLFLAVFVGTALIALPGMAFVIGGRLAFGPYVGFTVGYVGGVAAVVLPFVVARYVRGVNQAPWQPKNKWLAKAFGLVETHPFRAVVMLRAVLWFNAPLSYALAFSPIPTRTYVAACAVVLLPLVTMAMIATSWFL
jgi:uncharacterized membrane protein YdjX (TVP38/TMEM64 family)